MEIVIALFLGVWLITASVLGYRQLKKDFKPYLESEDKQ